jgi:hypothetical protein
MICIRIVTLVRSRTKGTQFMMKPRNCPCMEIYIRANLPGFARQRFSYNTVWIILILIARFSRPDVSVQRTTHLLSASELSLGSLTFAFFHSPNISWTALLASKSFTRPRPFTFEAFLHQTPPFKMSDSEKNRKSGEAARPAEPSVLPTVNPTAETKELPKPALHPAFYVVYVRDHLTLHLAGQGR